MPFYLSYRLQVSQEIAPFRMSLMASGSMLEHHVCMMLVMEVMRLEEIAVFIQEL